MIDKKEIKYILWALGFAFVLMVFIVPKFINSDMANNSIIAFLLFNVAVFVILQIVFKAVILSSSINFSEIVGMILIANGIDVLAPPYLVNTLGQITTNSTLANASSDFIIANLWQSVGVTGFYLYIATYVLSPVILFITAALLLKNFVGRL